MPLVVLGRKILAPFASHWALKVGGVWYELMGASKKDDNAKNEVSRRRGSKCSELGASPSLGGVVGTTHESEAEIASFIESWLGQHPIYNLMTCNCQMFVKDLADFVCEGHARLPMMDSGLRDHGGGSDSWSLAATCKSVARASVGRSEIQHGIFKFQAEGPNAGVEAIARNDEGFGVFADASLARVSGHIGPVGVRFEPNLNTGYGVRSGNFEANALGFGIKLGQDGIGVQSPIMGAECAVQ
mmetsp:Transcript_58522/g.164080  ORF Transcript_58522/g.164080 Transcript_58522/m.164080 type:complete len:243 (+) Transcript_58522:70-798(+)